MRIDRGLDGVCLDFAFAAADELCAGDAGHRPFSNSDRDEKCPAARQYVEQHHAPAEIADRFLALYRKVAN